MTADFIYDYGSAGERLATPEEYQRILDDIHNEFVKDSAKVQYKHEVRFNQQTNQASLELYFCNYLFLDGH